MKRFTRRDVILTAAGAASAGVCFNRALAETAPLDLSIATSSSGFAYGGLFIAEKAGLFAKRGIKPHIVVMDSGNAAEAALISGSVPFAGPGPGETLAARAKNQKVVIVGNFYRGIAASLIVAKSVADKLAVKADAPIADRLKALDGLSIAVPSPTSAYYHPVKSATEAAGAKLKFVYMTQPGMVAALESGSIQSFMAASPFSVTAMNKGFGISWISGPRAEFPANVQATSSACLQVTEAYAAAHPDTVRTMRDVLEDLATFIKEKPAEAKAALAAAYPKVAPDVLDKTFELDGVNWTRPAFSEADIAQEIKILQSTGLVTGVGDVKPADVLWKG